MAMFHQRHLLLLPRLLLDAPENDLDTWSPFPSPSPSRSVSPFRPGIAVIVAVLTIMFSLTFILLLYAKHCKHTTAETYVASGGRGGGSGFSLSVNERRHSGLKRAVVESLPVFRFGSLRGQKEGLECAVCLSRFEQAEALRLLPKCRHGFHVECVDTWLDAHSTCPLCRARVDPEDVLLIPQSEPAEHRGGAKGRESKAGSRGDGIAKTIFDPFVRRISGRHSWAGEKSGCSLQIVVQRTDSAESSYPRSADCEGCAPNAAPAAPNVRKDGLLPTEAASSTAEDREAFERRYSHRIVVSDGDRSADRWSGDRSADRWSDLQPSDLLFLQSEMIFTESGRFSALKFVRAPISLSWASATTSSRTLSEITGVSRLPSCRQYGRGSGNRRAVVEDRTMRRWFGFAGKRTALCPGGGGRAGAWTTPSQ